MDQVRLTNPHLDLEPISNVASKVASFTSTTEHVDAFLEFYKYLLSICLILMAICFAGIIICGSVLLLMGTVFGYRNPNIATSVHTMIVAGSGGHTSEMLRLCSGLSQRYYPRSYVVASTDLSSETKIHAFENGPNRYARLEHDLPAESHVEPSYEVLKIPRSREVRQSWLTSLFTTIFAVFYAIPLVCHTHPDLLLCNGPGTCIPICLMVKFVRFFKIVQTRVVFVESICRVQTLSLSGKILYHGRIADEIIVQWPELKVNYPRVRFIDRIV